MASLSWIDRGGQTSFSSRTQINPNGYVLIRIKKHKKHAGVPNVRSSEDRGTAKGSFVKSLDVLYPQIPCRFCKGRGKIPCDKCDGKGTLGRGGYQKNNPVNLERIVGSKWTARETTFGWRHFVVHTKQRGSAKDWFLGMVAVCDKNTHFWINSKNLKDRERWSMGWLHRGELMSDSGKSKGVSLCKACRGEGRLICTACDVQDGSKANRVEIIEV